MSDPMTPRTAAGRALLDELAESPLDGARYAHHVVGLRLAAIEAEAAALALDAAVGRVENIGTSQFRGDTRVFIDRRAILAALRGKSDG
jgi:hypothetical protein